MASNDGPVPLAHRVHGQGPVLMLVAGTGYPGATWPDALVGPLAQRHTVVTFDHRGTGATPGTADEYTTRLFAADAIGLLEELGVDRAHVLGHSMGGRVAQWMALDAPERVATLILAASGPGQSRADRPQARGIPLAAAETMIELGYEGYIAHQIRTTLFTPAFIERQPEVVDRLISAFWEHRPSLRDYLKHVVARQGHQTAELLDRIGQPTLVLVGELDTHVGGTGSHLEQSEYLAAHLPDAELRTVPGCRHGYFWQDPERSTAEVLGFLARRG